MSGLTVTGLHVRLEGAHIIQGVSLAVPRGRSVALVGHNGAGKTTLARAIMGLTGGLAGGRIEFAGRDLTQAPAWDRPALGLCYVPQSRRIFPSLTVEEHLAVAERPARPGERAWTRRDMFELFPNLASRRNNRGGLSGGEQQMLAIARALVGNPLAIILDEPSEGLAPVMVARVLDVLRELRRAELGILLVEQNYKFAASIAQDVHVQQAGRIVFSGADLDEKQIAEAVAASSGFGRQAG